MPRIVENLRVLRWISIFSVSLGLNGCSIGYLLRQGSAQASLLLKAEPLDQAMARLPRDKVDKLRYVRDVKAYAVRTIGLKQTGSYEKFVELDGSSLSHVVSASRRDRLESYLWNFPITGAVPYKGYFDPADAEAERKRLEAEGFDTHLRGVAAFSLLGIIADPIYSSMLQYGHDTLANLIIHELTHATVFLPGNSTFNEGFATYVGNAGALEFLTDRFGADSEPVKAALAHVHDDQVFSAFIGRTIARLRDFYARGDLSPAEKIAGRDFLFAEARREYAALPLQKPGHRAFGGSDLNNAYLLLFDTYQRDLSRFDRIRSRFASLKEMVWFFRDTVAKQPDPEAYLTSWESSPAP
jgi:predicted aminopeptidase